MPKIAQLVETRLHSWFDARCVEPKFQRVVLPSLWPRRRNVGLRGRDDSGEFEGEDSDDDDALFDKKDFAFKEEDLGGLRKRRQSTKGVPLDDQPHVNLSGPSAFEMPGTMPGGLPA